MIYPLRNTIFRIPTNVPAATLLAVFLVLCAVVLFTLAGCGSLPDLAARPPGCEQSLIYDTIPAPRLAGAGLLIATNEAIIAKPAAKPFVAGAIDRMIGALADDKVTYVELALLAVDNVKWINNYFGARLVAYTALLSIFDREIPIYPCDRLLLREHLEQQKAMLAV